MRMILFLLSLGLTATQASAATKHLSCSIERNGGAPWSMTVAVSEDMQIVTYHINNAVSFNRAEAMFTPTMIRWKSGENRSGTTIFMINRATLEMAMIEDGVAEPVTSKGTCLVSTAIKQAI